MRLLHLLVAAILFTMLPSGSQGVAVDTASLKKADLTDRFLLQINYERNGNRRDFNTSRSRIVAFRRDGEVLQMVDMSGAHGGASTAVLATIPIRGETASSLEVDLNAAFDTVSTEED